MTSAVVALTLFALAVPAEAPRPLAGVSGCALVEGAPGEADPIRGAPPVARAFKALDAARGDARRFLAAFARFDKALAPLFREARAAFHPEGELDRARARRFLARYVFAKDGVLRVGREGFEPRVEIAAAMAFAACRGGAREAAIAVGRAATGEEGAGLRAFAALLLLEGGDRAEAVELVATLGEGGFLAPWLEAELADDDAERRVAHARAAKRVATPDQATALAEQRRRFGLAP